MSPEHQRIAIAEACGWKPDDDGDGTGWKGSWIRQRLIGKKPTFKDGKVISYLIEQNVPDYLNDLNAMHSAILSLTPKQRLVFSDILNSIIPNGFYDDYYDGWVPSGNSLTFSESIFHIATAPTEMLAEAFLKTLNLWRP